MYCKNRYMQARVLDIQRLRDGKSECASADVRVEEMLAQMGGEAAAAVETAREQGEELLSSMDQVLQGLSQWQASREELQRKAQSDIEALSVTSSAKQSTSTQDKRRERGEDDEETRTTDATATTTENRSDYWSALFAQQTHAKESNQNQVQDEDVMGRALDSCVVALTSATRPTSTSATAGFISEAAAAQLERDADQTLATSMEELGGAMDLQEELASFTADLDALLNISTS